MLSQPSLNRFSQHRPMEKKFYGVKVITLLPECWVCGHRVDKQFLRKWNDQDTCRKCIDELEGEYERSIAPTSSSTARTN